MDGVRKLIESFIYPCWCHGSDNLRGSDTDDRAIWEQQVAIFGEGMCLQFKIMHIYICLYDLRALFAFNASSADGTGHLNLCEEMDVEINLLIHITHTHTYRATHIGMWISKIDIFADLVWTFPEMWYRACIHLQTMCAGFLEHICIYACSLCALCY